MHPLRLDCQAHFHCSIYVHSNINTNFSVICTSKLQGHSTGYIHRHRRMSLFVGVYSTITSCVHTLGEDRKYTYRYRMHLAVFNRELAKREVTSSASSAASRVELASLT